MPRHRPGPSASGHHRYALLLIDVINPFDFSEAPPLIAAAEHVAPRIAAFCQAARGMKVPVVYVNDNFGRWRSDFRAIVDTSRGERSAGRNVSALLHPHDTDYFVLKPLHSGFYSTVLEVLLAHLRVDSLVLTGFATNFCVLFTAHDAYMRGYRLFVPEDCTASTTPELTKASLAHMRQTLGASTEASEALRRKLEGPS